MSRIDEIANYSIRKEEQDLEHLVVKLNERKELEERIWALRPRIKELIDTANACLDSGISIKKITKDTRERYKSAYSFENVGFIYSDDGIRYVGIQYGPYYKRQFRTDGKQSVCFSTDDFVTKLGYKRDCDKYFNGDMKAFLNEFDIFENEFYAYVDSVCNSNK